MGARPILGPLDYVVKLPAFPAGECGANPFGSYRVGVMAKSADGVSPVGITVD